MDGQALYRLKRYHDDSALDQVLARVNLANQDERRNILRNMGVFEKCLFIHANGVDTYRRYMKEKNLPHHVFFTEYRSQDPELIHAFFNQCSGDFAYFNDEDAPLILFCLNDPQAGPEVAAWLVTEMESDFPEVAQWAFKIIFHASGRLSELGIDVAELFARELWKVKQHVPRRAVLRLQALGQSGGCAPARAAELIEQVFTLEDPPLWKTAAGAIKELKAADPAIQLLNAELIRERIASDPAKLEKALKVALC